jgi:hypothetical protein
MSNDKENETKQKNKIYKQGNLHNNNNNNNNNNNFIIIINVIIKQLEI